MKLQATSQAHEQSTMNTPGTCYLALFRDDVQEGIADRFGTDPMAILLKAHFADEPGNFAPGNFSVVLGTRRGVNFHVKRHCHVSRVSPQDSGLTAKDALHAIPNDYYIGGDDSTPDVRDVASPARQVPVTTLPFSMPADPSRAISFIVSGVTAPKLEEGKTTGFAIQSVNFCTMASPKAIISPWPVVQLLSAKVTVMPTPASVKYHTSLAACWYPNGETQPNGRDKVLMSPGAFYSQLVSHIPTGSFGAFTKTCPIGQDLLSRFIKPETGVGGHPLFGLWCSSTPLAGQKYQFGDELFELFFEITIKIGL
jgi:hypothetical protein